MTEPTFGSYAVEVRSPDGAVVHTCSEFAKSATECASRVLRYEWPISIYTKPLPPRRPAMPGLAGYRIIVTAKPHGGNTDSGDWTVGEVLLAQVAEKVRQRTEAQTKVREAKAALDKAREAYRGAQSMYRCAGYDIESRSDEARVAGVDSAEVEKAKKKRAAPRVRRKAGENG